MTFNLKKNRDKNRNKINNKRGTVESKHREQLKIFSSMKESLPDLQKQLSLINNNIKDIKTNKDYMNDLEIKILKLSQLEQEKTTLEDKIQNICSDKHIMQHYLKTGKILFQYYDSVNHNKQGLLNRYELYNEFNSLIDPTFVKADRKKDINKLDGVCDNCGVIKVLNPREAVKVCTECGKEETTFIDSDRHSYKDPPPELNYFAYRRINHFNELLAQLQAKESTNIPDEVFHAIDKELKKERKTRDDLNYKLCKDYLRKNGFDGYYDHIFYIILRMSGKKHLVMTPDMEEKLRYLFLAIQEPFDRHCPSDRKNFISYGFVFYKFCKLLGYTQFLQYFPQLKSTDKRHEQDEIFRKICEDLGINWKAIK